MKETPSPGLTPKTKPKKSSASRSSSPKRSRTKGELEIVPITQNPKPTLPEAPVAVLDPSDVASDRSLGPVAFGPTPLAAAFRFIAPSWRNYISYVDAEARTGTNPDAQKYLRMWKALPPIERKSHMPEQICELANIPAADLIAWVSRQVWQEGSAKAAMCMSFNRDKVIEKTAQFAMDSPKNYKHAELFYRGAGLLPTSPGRGAAPINIFNQPVASAGAVAGVKSETAPVFASGLRSMDDEIVELSRIMQTGGTSCAAESLDDDDDPEDDDPYDDED